MEERGTINFTLTDGRHLHVEANLPDRPDLDQVLDEVVRQLKKAHYCRMTEPQAKKLVGEVVAV